MTTPTSTIILIQFSQNKTAIAKKTSPQETLWRLLRTSVRVSALYGNRWIRHNHHHHHGHHHRRRHPHNYQPALRRPQAPPPPLQKAWTTTKTKSLRSKQMKGGCYYNRGRHHRRRRHYRKLRVLRPRYQVGVDGRGCHRHRKPGASQLRVEVGAYVWGVDDVLLDLHRTHLVVQLILQGRNGRTKDEFAHKKLIGIMPHA